MAINLESSNQLNLLIKLSIKKQQNNIKLDTLLIVIHQLLNDYDKFNISIDEDNTIYINENLKFLKEYLEKNVINSQTLSHVFANQNKSKFYKQLTSGLKPIRAYYKFLTSILSSKIKKGSYWLPEILAFSLIQTYKNEYNKSFSPYSAIDTIEVEKILQILNKKNLEFKKEISKKQNIPLWQVNTAVDDMYDLAEELIRKYLKYTIKNKKIK